MFKYDKYNASKLITAPSVERVVEFSPPGVEVDNISKVLSMAVDSKCMSVTPKDGYCDVDGRANFKLIYMDNDGMCRGVDYNADFSVKVDGDYMMDDMVYCNIDIIETDVMASDKLTMSAVVDVNTWGVRMEEFEPMVDAEKCYKTMKTMMYPTYIGSKMVTIPMEAEMEVGEVEAILMLDNNCIVKKCMAGENMCMVDAMGYATVTYKEDGMIKSQMMEMPVSEEYDMEGVMPNDFMYAECKCKGGKIILQGVTGDNMIVYNGDMMMKMYCYRMQEVEVIDDMFMLTNEVDITRSKQMYKYPKSMNYYSERVTGTAMLSDNRAAAREIVAMPYSRCYTTKSEVSEDGLTVEGVVNADIIYMDENGYNSVRTEVPFSMMIPGEYSNDVMVNCMVENKSARIKRDREMEVNLMMGIMVMEYDECYMDYIMDVEVGDEKEQNTSALSLYIASEGDEMWDVCKALTATPEDIMKQNPTMQTPLNEGEKIIYFRMLEQ